MSMRLRLKKPEDFRDLDCERIVKIFSERGYEISIRDAKEAWEAFSDSMAAGWMHLDEDDRSVFNTVLCYFEDDTEEPAENE